LHCRLRISDFGLAGRRRPRVPLALPCPAIHKKIRKKVSPNFRLDRGRHELTKIPETPDVYLWYWLRFFSAETKEELDMVATASPAIRKAAARVLKLSKDERARMLHEYKVKARDYELARLHGAREEGEQARALAIARNLLKMKMPLAKIAEATGFSIDEIKKLAH